MNREQKEHRIPLGRWEPKPALLDAHAAGIQRRDLKKIPLLLSLEHSHILSFSLSLSWPWPWPLAMLLVGAVAAAELRLTR